MKIIKIIIISIFIILFFNTCKSQPEEKIIEKKMKVEKADYSICEKYEFIDTLADTLLLAENISNFYKELYKTKDSVITIVQIGDSHLQAGFIPIELRKKLQTEFGNAGRGLIFPFNLYKSNQSYDFTQTTNIENWYGTNIVQFKQKYQSGINAAVLQTEDTGKIIFKLKNNDKENYFDKIKIFTANLDSLYNFYVSTENEIAKIDTNTNYKQFILDSATNNFCLEINKTAENQKQFLLHGILLEKQNANGIIYNEIGVNGATINHYNNSPIFFEELKEIKPSLVIISLGSNDANNSNITRNMFLSQLNKMIDQLREIIPNLSIILTTPVDHFYQRTKTHSRLETEFCFAVYDAAIEKRCAVIDLYGIGGGYGSAKLWQENKLLQNDGIHFTVEGYKIQATLIYNAIINAIH